MTPKKNTHKKPASPGYFHDNGRPLTAEEFAKMYENSNRKARRRIDAMKRKGIGIAPPQEKTA